MFSLYGSKRPADHGRHFLTSDGRSKAVGLLMPPACMHAVEWPGSQSEGLCIRAWSRVSIQVTSWASQSESCVIVKPASGALTAVIALQWTELASGDKGHAYLLTGAGLVGIVRVDCLEQDEPKEGFRCAWNSDRVD